MRSEIPPDIVGPAADLHKQAEWHATERTRIIDERDGHIYRLWGLGYSNPAIARAIGVSTSLINAKTNHLKRQ